MLSQILRGTANVVVVLYFLFLIHETYNIIMKERTAYTIKLKKPAIQNCTKQELFYLKAGKEVKYRTEN